MVGKVQCALQCRQEKHRMRNLSLSNQLGRKNNYASISFAQGPRKKNKATIYYEALIKDILHSYHQQLDLQVRFNSLKEIVIIANGHFYNLAQLLRHQPDFEQLRFSQDDLQIYDKFLRDPKTASDHIENILSSDELKKIEQAFPDMTRAEMSPIRHYTMHFYAPMNFLLKFNATKVFPKLDEHWNSTAWRYDEDNIDLKAWLSTVAEKLNPLADDYDPYDPIFLAAAVREILLGTAIASSALSRTQVELNVAISASHGDLQDNFNQISGATLVLIPHDNQFEIVMVAYGKITNKTALLDINKLLLIHQTMQPDGIALSPEEFKEIILQFSTLDKFSLLENLSPLSKTKLIDILIAEPTVNDLQYEPVIRIEEDIEYFTKNYLPAIYQLLNTNYSHHFYSGFYSSALGIDATVHDGLNILTILDNPILWGKNIELISLWPDEEERLLIASQEIAYTEAISLMDENNRTIIYLTGFPIRSIDGLDTYSHDEMLVREKIIGLPPSVKLFATESKNREVTQLQVSAAAPRAKPFYSDLSHSLLFTARLAGNFLYQNLIEKPVAELGAFAEFYLDYLNNITIEQCVMMTLVNNQHSLFHVPVNNVTLTLAYSDLPRMGL